MYWINDLEDAWTFDLCKTCDLVPVVNDMERASMRYLWRAASLHRHGESLAATAPDLTVLRRHLHSLRKRGLLDRAAMLQLAACGGLWPEQRRHEAFLQDHANCRVVTQRKLKQKTSFLLLQRKHHGKPDLVDLVARTDWILPEARAGLTKPELRSFCEV